MSNPVYTQSPIPGPRGPQLRPGIPSEDRSAAAMAHFSTIIAMVVSVGWLSFVGPLAVWWVYRDRSAYVRHAAAGAFNFNVWATVVMVVGQLLTFTFILAPVGIPMMVVAGFLMLWTHTRAGLRALRGEDYQYRRQLRILS